MFRKHNLYPLSYLLNMNLSKKKKKWSCRRYPISGARRLSNFIWTFILFAGSIGFLFIGFSSYLNLFLHYENIQSVPFFPQGLVMIFYGFLGFFLSFYLGLTLFWSLGSGFNEFNKRDAYVRIFRWGFPGRYRRIDFYYSWEDIQGLRVEFKQGLSEAKFILFLQIRGQKEIPLTHIGEPLTFEEIEKRASALAQFLQVSLNIQANI